MQDAQPLFFNFESFFNRGFSVQRSHKEASYHVFCGSFPPLLSTSHQTYSYGYFFDRYLNPGFEES